MATVQSIITDALTEIGAYSVGEALSAADAALGLRRLQHQLDSWNADNLTLATLRRETFTLTSSTSTVTIGQSGTPTITAPRPLLLQAVNYVVVGSSPAVEVPMGAMDEDSYAAQAIKALTSTYPTQYFYTPSTPNGTIFFWPTPSQNVSIALYYEDPITVPVALTTDLVGPPGYQDAFMYQLAIRLCTPFGRSIPEALPSLAAEAFAKMKRPNNAPGLLGVDAALSSAGGGYNILSDGFAGYS